MHSPRKYLAGSRCEMYSDYSWAWERTSRRWRQAQAEGEARYSNPAKHASPTNRMMLWDKYYAEICYAWQIRSESVLRQTYTKDDQVFRNNRIHIINSPCPLLLGFSLVIFPVLRTKELTLKTCFFYYKTDQVSLSNRLPTITVIIIWTINRLNNECQRFSFSFKILNKIENKSLHQILTVFQERPVRTKHINQNLCGPHR